MEELCNTAVIKRENLVSRQTKDQIMKKEVQTQERPNELDKEALIETQKEKEHRGHINGKEREKTKEKQEKRHAVQKGLKSKLSIFTRMGRFRLGRS